MAVPEPEAISACVVLAEIQLVPLIWLTICWATRTAVVRYIVAEALPSEADTAKLLPVLESLTERVTLLAEAVATT